MVGSSSVRHDGDNAPSRLTLDLQDHRVSAPTGGPAQFDNHDHPPELAERWFARRDRGGDVTRWCTCELVG